MLVIDSATESCSVALYENGNLLAGDFAMLGRGHAERLIPMIAALPERGRADKIAVALGPGSFTGLRIGIAAARALEFAWDAAAIGYPTLALIAAMARAQYTDAGDTPAITVCTTGGHGQWFIQPFDHDGTAMAPLASLAPADAVRHFPSNIVAGSQAEAFVEMQGHGTALAIWPDARAFHLLSPAHYQSRLAPLYGRGPDAKLPRLPRQASDAG